MTMAQSIMLMVIQSLGRIFEHFVSAGVRAKHRYTHVFQCQVGRQLDSDVGYLSQELLSI